jgi:hypothetical protein
LLWLSADLVSQKEIDFRLCLDQQRLRGDYAGLIRAHNGDWNRPNNMAQRNNGILAVSEFKSGPEPDYK